MPDRRPMGSLRGQRRRVPKGCAFAAGFVLTCWAADPALSQALTRDLFSTSIDGYAASARSSLSKTPTDQTSGDITSSVKKPEPNSQTTDDPDKARNPDVKAPSRIGKIPVYDVPPASGASASGFDSLNRKLKKPKIYPGAPKSKNVGPGTPPISANALARIGPPSATASKPPVAPSVAGTVIGQPARRRLKPDNDPFGNVGDYYGSVLVKSAVEVSAGYDTNPGRLNQPKGSPLYVIAPELLAATDWSRHSIIADLRGSFSGYGNTFPPVNGVFSSVPTNVDRPNFIGIVDGRLDVSRDTRINGEGRLRVSTDNPGSPNIQAGLSKYPLFATTGATLGVEQDFNRLQFSVNGLIDHTTYQESKLTDGTSTTNDDRNFNQYGGSAKVSYDLLPGVRPFGELTADTRIHEQQVDRFGFQRDSNGGTARAGTTFEFSRILTGDIAAGYALREYEDPRLTQLAGLLTSASLTWSATGLTTAKLFATSSIDESTLPGVSGVLSRDYIVQVDHAFRRWLIGTGKLGFGTSDYGGSRFDKRYFAEANIVYKLNRTFQIKGSVRHDWLQSNLLGYDSNATVVLLGIRVQR